MMGEPNTGSERGTRLRALDEQTLVPPEGDFFQYSNIPLFLMLPAPALKSFWLQLRSLPLNLRSPCLPR
jgi:hypothetical protein